MTLNHLLMREIPLKVTETADGRFVLSVAIDTNAIADGSDVALGATTDAAVVAGAAGTVSAKLRAISRDIGTLVTRLVVGVQALAASLSVNDSSATLYAGSGTISTSATAIAGSQAVREVLVQNDPDNTVDIFVGNSTAQPIQLKPGQSIAIPASDLATVYAKSASGTPTLNYLGRS